MSITNLLNRAVALSVGGAMLMLSFVPSIASAAGEIAMTPAPQGSTVLAQNGTTTVLAEFAPDLDLASSTSANLEASATSSTKAYYGIRTVSATSSPDVHWEIVISHATDALASGDVTIREVGTFDVDSGKVRTTPATYTATEVSGDLILQGDTAGWSVANGDDFTNVDEIVFANDAPLGTYTITKALVNETLDTNFADGFSFTVNLTAAATSTTDTTAPDAPVVTFPTSPYSTTTTPLTLTGTAEASSTITVTGGAATSTATTSGAGDWSAAVDLTASSTNMLSVFATDEAGNMSLPTIIQVNTGTSTGTSTGTTTTATTTPVITLIGDNPINVFSCNGFTDPGFTAVDSNGATSTITSSTTGTVDITKPGTYTITYTATDSGGHTATTTRTVIVLNCSSGRSHSRSGDFNRGIAQAASVTPGAITIPGQAIGLNLFQQTLLPPGQVLGASTFLFNNNLRVGSRGQDVIELQTRLTQTGYYSGPITGYFGGLTRAALVKFQKAVGLPNTGFFGPMTRGILNS